MERMHAGRLVGNQPLLRVAQLHGLIVVSLFKWLSIDERRQSVAGHAEPQGVGILRLVFPFGDVAKKPGHGWILVFFFGPLCVVAARPRFHDNVDHDYRTSRGWGSWPENQYAVAGDTWRPNQNIHTIPRRHGKVILVLHSLPPFP